MPRPSFQLTLEVPDPLSPSSALPISPQSLLTMGRYDFRPARVHVTASRLLDTQRTAHPPPWYNAIGAIPPAAILTRPQAIPHQRRAKRSKMFKPQPITYPEDKLRKEFFAHHPWELARPRVVTEEDGKDGRQWNWDSITPKGRPLNGER